MTYIFYFLNVIKKYICNVLKPSPNPVSSSPKTIDSRRFSKGNKGHPNHRGEWVQIANPATFHPPVSTSPSFSRSSHWQAASMPPKNKNCARPSHSMTRRNAFPHLSSAPRHTAKNPCPLGGAHPPSQHICKRPASGRTASCHKMENL